MKLHWKAPESKIEGHDKNFEMWSVDTCHRVTVTLSLGLGER